MFKIINDDEKNTEKLKHYKINILNTLYIGIQLSYSENKFNLLKYYFYHLACDKWVQN